MTEPDAALRGILERNVAAAVGGETAGYHLNHVTIEIDTSEIGDLDESMEGLPVSIEGRFETREHPESGTRWVFKVQALRADTPGGEGPPLSAPPPPA
jgi:hypothetical protein